MRKREPLRTILDSRGLSFELDKIWEICVIRGSSVARSVFTGGENLGAGAALLTPSIEMSLWIPKEKHLLSQVLFFWWRRGELNPRPKTLPQELLRAQTVLSIPLP